MHTLIKSTIILVTPRAQEAKVGLVWLLLYAHRRRSILGGVGVVTDTSEPVDGNGAQNMVTVQSGFEPATFRSLAHELFNCSNRALKGSKEESRLPIPNGPQS
jgi:hypothetical protein